MITESNHLTLVDTAISPHAMSAPMSLKHWCAFWHTLLLFEKATSIKYNFCKPAVLLQMSELPNSAANQQTKFYPMLQEGAAKRRSDALTSSNVLLSVLRVYSNHATAGAKVWERTFLFYNLYLRENSWHKKKGLYTYQVPTPWSAFLSMWIG